MSDDYDKKKPLISIVLPVYNSDKFIEQTLKSLQKQSFEDFETLIIDDGSRDNSVAIIQKFCRNDNRFQLFKIDNHGPSFARSIGIHAARGDYITFIDSDDIALSFWLETLKNLIIGTQADIGVVNYANFYSNKKKYYSKSYSPNVLVQTKKDFLKEWLLDRRLKGFLWNKIFKRELIVKNNTPVNFSWLEDSFLVLNCLNKANRVAYSNKVCYMYRIRKNSTINLKFKVSDKAAFIAICQRIHDIYSSFPDLYSLRDLRLIRLQLMLLSKMDYKQINNNKEFCQSFIKIIDRNKEELNLNFNKIDVLLLSRIKGIKLLYFVVKLRNKLLIIQQMLRKLICFNL